MWVARDTKTPIAMKDLLDNGFDIDVVKPEPLSSACMVSLAIHKNRQDVVYAMERTANEPTDTPEQELHVRRKLAGLFNEILPILDAE